MPAKAIGEKSHDGRRTPRRDTSAARAAGRTGDPHPPCRRLSRRPRRWDDAVAELTKLQVEYDAWLQNLPVNLQDTATAEALRAISELDLSELQAVVPPRGFGRD
jgi:hypothetical protein